MHSSITLLVSVPCRISACVSAAAARFFLRLLRTSIHPQRSDTAMIAGLPPYMRANPTAKAIVKAPTPVTNHPDTTVITPVIRYTALSRPQALSASDEPIETMKQT